MSNTARSDPRHWRYGGLNFHDDYKTSATCVREQLRGYINDIDEFEECEWAPNKYGSQENRWERWGKPPIRAIVQQDAYARDLSIFMNLLEGYLYQEYYLDLQICFKPVFPMNMLSEPAWDSLWFNAVAFGDAISAICAGLSGLKVVDKKCRRKIIVEYGCNKLERQNGDKYFFYFKIYEYLFQKNRRWSAENNLQYEFPYIPFNSDCWVNPHKDIGDARKSLYIGGFNTLLYSAHDGSRFQSRIISLPNYDQASQETIEINSYKIYPPFLFFGLPFRCPPRVSKNRQIEIAEKAEIEKIVVASFRSDYESNNH